MTDNELLLALSEMLDRKLEPIKRDTLDIKVTLENDVMPRLQNIENCYTSTYKRYQSGANQIEAMQSDIDLMKMVITEHSKEFQKIS